MAEYIKREDVCNICNNQQEFCGKEKCPVYRAPKADVAPVRHGHWIDMQKDDQTEGMWRCSCCGDDRYFYDGHPLEYEFKFCPNCGARMDGGIDGEN